jgi:hypothetical protein
LLIQAILKPKNGCQGEKLKINNPKQQTETKTADNEKNHDIEDGVDLV